MKIIHTADLHLFSPLSANLNGEKATIRRNEILNSFERLTKYAKENSVEAILISGDLFDADGVSAGSLRFVFNIIKENASIRFFYLKGNHDFNVKIGDVPENLKIFDKEFDKEDFRDITIGAYSGKADNYGNINFSRDSVNILLMHGDIEKNDGEDSVVLPKLSGKNIDYIALGHIHSYRFDRIDERTSYAYSGCLDGRGYDECGPKGFVLLDISDGHIRAEFIEFQSRLIEEIKTDITGCETNFDVYEKVDAELSGKSPSSMIKLILTGKLSEDNSVSISSVAEKYKDTFFGFKLSDTTSLLYDAEKYKYDDTLKGEFIRYVANSSEYTDEEKLKITETGLKAINGEALI